ncbi:MAG: DUF3426 domain-containing protein [Pseudolabrys sp.]|jgi:predicted Zn finger-like uncharacterized protein
MLIVCPNCATSYMIDQAAVGPAGRTVRCARCKASWHAGGPVPAPDVTARADTVAAEAQAQPTSTARAEAPPPPVSAAPPPAQAADADDHGATESESVTATEDKSPPIKQPPPEPPPPAATVPAEPPVLQPVEPEASEPEPVTIVDAPPLVPPIEHEPQSEAAESESEAEAAASFDARRKWLQARRKQSRRSSRWTAVILVLVAANVALVGARNEVVRYLPQTASLFAAIGLPVNLRNLKFENVKLSTETNGGINLLIVQGAIVSEAGKPVAVPRLRFALRNATGQEVYSWTMPPPRSILDSGERLEFRSQVPAPQVDATDVMVRFFTAQDAGAK